MDNLERLEVYKAMLEYFMNPGTMKRGLCYTLYKLFDDVDLDDLHELNFQEPQHEGIYWWPIGDTQKRIDALNIAISQLS